MPSFVQLQTLFGPGSNPTQTAQFTMGGTPSSGGQSYAFDNPLLVAHPGSFSNTSNNFSLATNTNGCNPSTLYSSVQYRTNLTAAVEGCVNGPAAGSGAGLLSGLFGFASSQDAVTEVTGGSFYGFGTANGVHVFGANPVAQDIAGLTSNVQMVGQETDVQPYNPPSSYSSGAGLAVDLINNTNNGGVYPFSAIQVSARVNGGSTPAYWRNGLNFTTGALNAGAPAININPVGLATAGGNYNCPPLLTAYESYWNGTAAAYEGWTLGCVVSSGTNPAADYMQLSHGNGNPPAGQKNVFELMNGIQLQLDGATSGSAMLSASAANGTLNLGSTNATVDASGNLTVSSCSGCGSSSAPSWSAVTSGTNTQTGAFATAAPWTFNASMGIGGSPLANTSLRINTVGYPGTPASASSLTVLAPTGATANYEQLWESSAGSIHGAMTDAGVMGAAEFLVPATGTASTAVTSASVQQGIAGAYSWSSSSNALGTRDTSICRSGAGIAEVANGATCNAGGSLLLAGMAASGSGAASTPGVSITGAPYTGGTGTTNFPQLYLNQGAAVTTLSAAGTELGINAPSGFVGHLLNLFVNGGSTRFRVDYQGNTFVAGTETLASTLGLSSAAAPSIANGAGAGTSPGTPTVTGNNNAGVITVTTGTATPASATLATVTFNGTLGTVPQGCGLTPRNAATTGVNLFFTTAPTSTAFTIGVGGTAATASTTYSWSYLCL